jgi:hypothetical protein
VEALKLRIAILMRSPFARLSLGLQAIARPVQQLGHQAMAGAVTLTAQFLGQLTQALASPAERKVRGSPALGLALQCGGTSPAATRSANPSTTAVFPTPASPVRMGLV